MRSALYASAALTLAAGTVAAVGSAQVVNNCPYDVQYSNVPSDSPDKNGGFSPINGVLKAGGQPYSQEYTQLANKNGWSIKLSKNGNFQSPNVYQFEYTYHGDGVVSYDMSGVDGNPWNGNAVLVAKGGFADAGSTAACAPEQSFYRCWSDDPQAMQHCTDDSSLILHLCPSTDGSDTAISSAIQMFNQLAKTEPQATCAGATLTMTYSAFAGAVASGVNNVVNNVGNQPGAANVFNAAPGTTSAAPPPAAPTPVSSPAPVAHSQENIPASSAEAAPSSAHHGGGQWRGDNAVAAAPVPTTFKTLSTAELVDTNGHVVTDVITVIETALVTTTIVPRHLHHPHHQH